MKRKKIALAAILDRFKILNLAAKFNQRKLIIINYHRVYKKPLKTAFDYGVFGPSVDEFDQQMRWLKGNTDILSEKDVLRMIKTDSSIPRRSTMITFDDGYIDNYHLAYPVLKKLNIPSIFFIPTGPIEKRRLGWWDLISYFIRKSDKKKFKLGQKEYDITDEKEQSEVIKYFLKYMKTVKSSESKNLLESLSKACDVKFPNTEEQSAQLMTWDHIKKLHANNVAIGAHTDSHRVLSTLPETEQLKELQKSKAILEYQLNSIIRSFSYPVGNYSAFGEETKRAVQKAGYKIAFSFNTGVNNQKIVDPYNVKRIAPRSNFSVYQATVIMPSLFV